MCTVCTVCTVQGVPGVVVRHVGPLAYVGMKASPSGEVGRVAVAEVPLTDLNTINLTSWLCKMCIKIKKVIGSSFFFSLLETLLV